MIIQTPAPDEVTGHAAEMYSGDIADVGFVLSHTQALAVNPEAHQAFEGLLHAIVPSIGIRVYELATLGAARAIGSSHCLLAHGRKTLRAELMDEDQLARVARDYTSAGLSEADVAVMAYAEKLSSDPRSMTDADSERLRAVGFSDRQIVDITLAAAARNFLSRALLALAVPTDEVPDLGPELVAALLSPLDPAP
ncbi:carboxymuconolactone decarboxylase family protein [Microbacterium sp. NPDC056003]|uniref:carboxymuconolactone decarboxylase family protein n=1 Tax=Microbacterium sp. NPDC056003 TaxID=3345676 RepID=UPI0035E041CB